MNFELKNEPYIELIKLLKLLGLAESGGDAKHHVDEGSVVVNDEVEFRKRRKLIPGDIVEFSDKKISIL